MTQRNKNSVETRLIHGDRKLNSTSAVVAPIYQTATFRGVSGEDFAKRAGEARHPEFYTRYGNPTLSQVESVLAALEGTESALVTASGMAAHHPRQGRSRGCADESLWRHDKPAAKADTAIWD